MIVIIGLFLLVVSTILAVAGVVTNNDSAHLAADTSKTFDTQEIPSRGE